jgi:antimicrobial peptide system SdpA family protein
MRMLGVHALILTFGWSFLAVYSVHGAMPYNPVGLPFEDALKVSRLLPQGWAFFTRDPREDRLTAHRLGEDAQLEPFGRSPHSRWVNILGLNRRSRAEGVEIALLVAGVQQLDPNPWTSCQDAPGTCALAMAEAGRVHELNPVVPRPLVCGDIIVKLEAPVPWAWSQSPPPSSSSRLLAMRVRC